MSRMHIYWKQIFRIHQMFVCKEFVEICLKRGKYWRLWSCSWPGPKRVCKSYCHWSMTLVAADPHVIELWHAWQWIIDAPFGDLTELTSYKHVLDNFPCPFLSPLIPVLPLAPKVLRVLAALITLCSSSLWPAVPLRSNSSKWVSFQWLS